jgi:hypothetical protein
VQPQSLQDVLADLDKKEQEAVEKLDDIRRVRASLRKLFMLDEQLHLDGGLGVSRSVIVAPTQPDEVREAAEHPRKAPGKKSVAWIEAVHALLREKRRPMSVREMVDEFVQRGIAIGDQKRARDTIRGVVTRKARNGEIFTHVGKGTFGLISWPNGKADADGDLTDATISGALLDIVRRTPGLTAGQIVDRYATERGEPSTLSQLKRNSRMTRVGQLHAAGAFRREPDGSYYFNLPRLPFDGVTEYSAFQSGSVGDSTEGVQSSTAT